MADQDTDSMAHTQLTVYISTLVMTCPLCKTVNSAGVNKEMVMEDGDSICVEIKCRKCKSDYELSGSKLTLCLVENGSVS